MEHNESKKKGGGRKRDYLAELNRRPYAEQRQFRLQQQTSTVESDDPSLQRPKSEGTSNASGLFSPILSPGRDNTQTSKRQGSEGPSTSASDTDDTPPFCKLDGSPLPTKKTTDTDSSCEDITHQVSKLDMSGQVQKAREVLAEIEGQFVDTQHELSNTQRELAKTKKLLEEASREAERNTRKEREAREAAERELSQLKAQLEDVKADKGELEKKSAEVRAKMEADLEIHAKTAAELERTQEELAETKKKQEEDILEYRHKHIERICEAIRENLISGTAAAPRPGDRVAPLPGNSSSSPELSFISSVDPRQSADDVLRGVIEQQGAKTSSIIIGELRKLSKKPAEGGEKKTPRRKKQPSNDFECITAASEVSQSSSSSSSTDAPISQPLSTTDQIPVPEKNDQTSSSLFPRTPQLYEQRDFVQQQNPFYDVDIPDEPYL
jgi:myosin heavy subunit